MPVIDKSTIDKFFSTNYNTMTDIANLFIKKYRRNYDPALVISECYLYITRSTKDIDCLEAFVKYWIKQNIIWTRSKLNYRYANTDTSELSDVVLNIYEDDIINVEYINNTIDDFSNTLSTYDKSLFNIYYIKGIDTAEKIKKHLNISRSLAYRTVKECHVLEDKLKEYVNGQ